MTCNDLNSHPRDALLHFDAPSHTYHYEGAELKSVTCLVEESFPAFDAEYWAARKAAQSGVSVDEILRLWAAKAEEARSLGTAMHEKIERYYLGDDGGDDGDAYTLFRRFAYGTTLHPYRTEWRIFDEDFGIAGTLDFLERRPDGTFNIYDWKRSKKLIAADGRIKADSHMHRHGLYPLSHLPDTAYWHYAMQLSIYRAILLRKYGIAVHRMILGVFHPTYTVPWTIEVPYLEREVTALLHTHRTTQPALFTV